MTVSTTVTVYYDDRARRTHEWVVLFKLPNSVTRSSFDSEEKALACARACFPGIDLVIVGDRCYRAESGEERQPLTPDSPEVLDITTHWKNLIEETVATRKAEATLKGGTLDVQL